MAFTNYVPPLLNPAQSGAMPDLIGSLLSGYGDMTKARYLQPTLEQELQKAKLFNQYYGPDIESKIGLRGAQASEAKAHTGLFGEQTKGVRIQNQYLPQYEQAQIDQLQAQAEKARLTRMIREKMFGDGAAPSVETGQNTQGMPMFGGQGMPSLNQIESGQQNLPQITNQPNYGQAAVISQMMGLGQPKIVEANGKYIAITPMGAIDTGVSSLTEQEKSFQKGLGSTKAKFYEESVNNYRALENQDLALNGLKNAVEHNPEFMNVTGPIQKPITEWLGTSAQKELLGTLQTESGEIALQIAPSLKGAFTGRDQTLINTIKASPRDFPDVFIGKLKAQMLINNALKERSKRQAELIEEGYSPIKAADKAAKETPLSHFEPMVRGLIKHRPQITSSEAKAELQRRHIKRVINER